MSFLFPLFNNSHFSPFCSLFTFITISLHRSHTLNENQKNKDKDHIDCSHFLFFAFAFTCTIFSFFTFYVLTFTFTFLQPPNETQQWNNKDRDSAATVQLSFAGSCLLSFPGELRHRNKIHTFSMKRFKVN